MANRLQILGIQVLNTLSGVDMQLGTEIFSFTAVRTAAGLGLGFIVGGEYGRFLTDTGVLDSAGRRIVEATTAADSAHSSGKKIVGLAAKVMDVNGNDFNIQAANATTAGLVQCYTDPNLIYVAMMSAVPTAYGGSFELLVGAPGNYNPITAMEDNPVPTSSDKLDATTYNATAGYHAFNCKGIYPAAQNLDAASAFPALFQIDAGFKS